MSGGAVTKWRLQGGGETRKQESTRVGWKETAAVLLAVLLLIGALPGRAEAAGRQGAAAEDVVGAVGSFADVPSGAWYAQAVRWAVSKGITSGTGRTTFSPNRVCTRAQILTFLWRLAGSPSTAGSIPYRDVPSGKYYAPAIRWALQKKIATGVSSTAFGPERACTRGEAVTFLWKYSGSPAVSGGTAFRDVSSSASYAKAVRWAASRGITSGTTKTTFSPNQSCTRAQIVTFLYRMKNGSGSSSVQVTTMAQRIAATRTAKKTSQIILVNGHTLSFWQKSSSGWRQLTSAYCGYGSRGMKLASKRREGDRTTPIGSFPILHAFGKAANPGTAMTWRKVTRNSYWSGKMDKTYNTWVESRTKWKGEHLIDYYQYAYAMAIGFNRNPTVPGRGSAIFLHCKSNGHWSTAGCVSVQKSVMIDLLRKARNGCYIIIVPGTASIASY